MFRIVVCVLSVIAILAPINGIAAGFGSRISNVLCYLPNVECCDAYWIPDDISGLKKSLQERVHGQHVAANVVLKSLENHVRSTNPPSKALVLSFHGYSGIGKNSLSKMIAKHTYRLGMKSRFVHLLIATRDFLYAEKIDEYKGVIQKLVESSVSECGRSLFVFDEVEKMPDGLLSCLKPYVDHYEKIDGVDYRSAIFIIISNSGGDVINRIVLNWWLNGKAREKIKLRYIEKELEFDVFNAEGGLKRSSLIKNNVITTFVPFLPLERSHVRLCVRDELIARNRTLPHDLINGILDELPYFPDDLKIFSTKGCKPVSAKVTIFEQEDET